MNLSTVSGYFEVCISTRFLMCGGGHVCGRGRHTEKDGGQEQEEQVGVDGGCVYIQGAEEEGLPRILFFEYLQVGLFAVSLPSGLLSPM